MKTIAFAAAVAVATVAISAAATPAFAQAEGRFQTAKVTYNAKTDRYCFRWNVTGMLTPVSECRTKAEWAQEGLTIHHKSAVVLAQR